MLRCSTGPRKALIGLLGSFAVLAVFAVVAAQPASAKPTATFTVTNTLDDGSAGSLRWAILQANLAPGFDTINVTANGTVTLVSSQIVISNPLFINGPGASFFVIDAAQASRVFSITQASDGVALNGIAIILSLIHI